MARIIINGDDFGMNESCSHAIAEAFGRGLITDTTAMSNGEYFDAAVRLAKERGFADRIGIHLNLTEGEPLTGDIRKFPDFVTDGRFNKLAASLNRELAADEYEAVYAELSAQIERLRSAGIGITHADSHHYIHNLPCLLSVAVRACRDNGINKLRLKRDLSKMSAAERKSTADCNAGLRSMGFITTEHFGRPSDICGGDIPDNTELLVHPDFDRNGSLIDRRSMSGGYPVGEILPDLRSIHGTELISYAELN